MTATDRAVLLIEEIEAATPQQLIIVARCLATVRTGARFHHVRDTEEPIDLTVVETWRYATIQIDEIDPPHTARVILTGTGGTMIRPGQSIEGTNPATA